MFLNPLRLKKVKNLIFKLFTLNNLTYNLKTTKRLKAFSPYYFVAIDFHIIHESINLQK